MLQALKSALAPQALRSTRLFAHVAETPGSLKAVSPPIQPAVTHYPYYVPRNTNGNLPVYTDIRNGGTRYMVMIRNVDGDANVLARDLAATLFQRDSPEASRMKIDIQRSRSLVITGGRWRHQVSQWLSGKGF